MIAPQPWNELHLKFYYQMQGKVGRRSRVCSMRCARPTLTRTRSWSSAPTTATCTAPTAGCTRNGTSPTRRRYTCRSSCPARCSRRRPRARHPDQPRRPLPDAVRPRRHRPGPGAHPRSVRPHRRPPARRARPLAGDPRRRTGRAHGADPLHHRRRDQRGQRDDGQPVRTRRPRRCTATRPSSSPTTCRPSSPRSTSTASSTWSSSPATTTTRSSGPSPASVTSACMGERR